MGMLQRLAPGQAAPETEGGYFGKLPGEGDFVVGRVPRALRERLDDWLQRSLETSRRKLGDAWTNAFDAMPPWCFVLGPAIDGAPVVGVMGPSRDRVGRRFPLIVLARLDDHRGPVRALCDEEAWFAAAAAAIGTARDHRAGLARLETSTRRLPSVGGGSRRPGAASDPDEDRSLWWSPSRDEAAARFAATGLPPPEAFHRMLDRAEPAPPPADGPPAADRISSATPPAEISVSAASHAGTRWRINADAVSRTDRFDLFAVADGAGDGMEASEAARLTVERLDRLPEAATPEELVQLAKGALGRANALLRTRFENRSDTGASVAVLVLKDGRHAVLWAGDVRVHLLRDGLMRPLTRDHSETGFRRRPTRGVGMAPQFQPELAGGEAQAGDRFLVCTRSLIETLGERAVAEILIDRQAGARRLVEDALIAGAAENVSAFVADVEEAAP